MSGRLQPSQTIGEILNTSLEVFEFISITTNSRHVTFWGEIEGLYCEVRQMNWRPSAGPAG